MYQMRLNTECVKLPWKLTVTTLKETQSALTEAECHFKILVWEG